MKKTFITAVTIMLTTLYPITVNAATPVATYSFDGDYGNATPVERIEYYSNAGIVESDGSSFTYKDGMLGQCLHMDGFEALKFNLNISSESYTVSYWMKPDKITNCTPSLMITPMGFEADTFINVTLSVDNLSPNIWTHMIYPYDERSNTGVPGILSTDEWYYITVVVDENMSASLLDEYGVRLDEFNSGAALYINGFLMDIGKAPKSICTDTTEYWFGVNIWDDLYMGYVDELSFFDQALTENEIKDLYLSAGGNPDAQKPVGSTRPNGGEIGQRPNGGSFSDDYIHIEQGTVNGNNNHLNLSNASPIATQGTESTTNAYSETALVFCLAFTILTMGFLLQYLKQKKNSY